MRSQRGSAAILVLLLVVACIGIMGLAMDIGLTLLHRTRLDYATEAAARAALRICRNHSNMPECAAEAADAYLRSHMPTARIADVAVPRVGALTVSAFADLEPAFAAMWDAPPVRMTGRFTASDP